MKQLVTQVEALLAPGDISLAGAIVSTDFDRDREIDLHEATVEIGDIVARAAGEPDWYIYSGNDDPEFASNQHQGLTVADDAFIWECQHLLRGETFELVMYYEASVDQYRVIGAIEAAGYDVIGVDGVD